MRMRAWPILSAVFLLVAMALAAGPEAKAAGGGAWPAAAEPRCLFGGCAGARAAPITPVQFLENNLKQESIYRCCIRYVKGQPLIGFYCSRKHLDMAFRRDVIRIITGADGRRYCAPTGRPF